MTPTGSGKNNKKKRTLVVIDGDALHEGGRYDFSFLESEKRLEIWFFYKERINHSFRLRRDFSAQNVLLPRYEEDLHLYILKRVCYELGRREGRYRKVLLIGEHHPIWEGLVQFLRERGLSCTHVLAGDYRLESAEGISVRSMRSPEPDVSESVSPAPAPTPPAAPPRKRGRPPKSAASAPDPVSQDEVRKLFRRKGRASESHMQVYQTVLNALRALPSGTEMTRADFRRMLKNMNIAVKTNLPGKNLNYFIGRLQEAGFVSTSGGKIIVRAQS